MIGLRGVGAYLEDFFLDVVEGLLVRPLPLDIAKHLARRTSRLCH